MSVRLSRRSRTQIRALLKQSGETWGLEAAERYLRLMLAVFAALGREPYMPGSRPIAGLRDWRRYHLRTARGWFEPRERVGDPKNLIIYRVGPDGVTEILGLVHERMLIEAAARRIARRPRE